MATEQPLQRIVVAHVMWVDCYQGDVGTARNVGHRFAKAGRPDEASGEVNNFLPVDGRCYGYVPRFKPRDEDGNYEFKSMNIDRLGAHTEAEELNGVTVCWTATPEPGADRVVVGWYQDATAYRWVREIKEPKQSTKWIYFSAPADRCLLIPAELRHQAIPLAKKTEDGDGPGTDALFYPRRRVTNLLTRYLKESPAQVIDDTSTSSLKRRPSSAPKKPDPESRSKVENAAIEEVQRLLTAGGWEHSDVSGENLGWDIGAKKPNHRSLRIEVKGLSGPIATVELTRNEYEHLLIDDGSKMADRFVVAIVTEAVDQRRRKLQAFSVTKLQWLPFNLVTGTFMPDTSSYLAVTPVTAARCSVVLFPR